MILFDRRSLMTEIVIIFQPEVFCSVDG